jgi:hypothetical protein
MVARSEAAGSLRDCTMTERGYADEGRAPICPACGVTALPAELANVLDAGFVCDNAECDAFGEHVGFE